MRAGRSRALSWPVTAAGRGPHVRELLFFRRAPQRQGRALITGFCRRGGLLPNVVLELEGIEAAKKMVEKGIGITMLPQLAVRQELWTHSLVHVRISDARSLARHVDLVYRREATLSEIARAFRHHVQRAFPVLEHTAVSRAVRRAHPR